MNNKFYRVILALLIAVCLVIVIVASINDTNIDTVSEWTGKTLTIPKVEFVGSSADYERIKNSSYKIFVYVDSAGCFSCQLQLDKWKDFIAKHYYTNNDVSIVFYFNLDNRNMIDATFANEGFSYPYFFDKRGLILKSNDFPNKFSLKTFLLDKENKVLCVGNPVVNPNVERLYDDIISKSLNKSYRQGDSTKVKITPVDIDFGNMFVGDVAYRKIEVTNIGDNDLRINKIGASCDCISVLPDAMTVSKGKTIKLMVKYTARHEADLYENIYIESNAKPCIPTVNIRGAVIRKEDEIKR